MAKQGDQSLLINVHLHALFCCKVPPKDQTTFKKEFTRRFGNGSRIERVRDVGRKTSYILRTPNTRALLDVGQYPVWSRSVRGLRRIRTYGEFRRDRARWNRARMKPVQCGYWTGGVERYELVGKRRYKSAGKPKAAAGIVELNTKVAEIVRYRRGVVFRAQLVMNATDSCSAK